MKTSRDLRRLLQGVCLAAGAFASCLAGAQRIVAISSDDTEPYQLAAGGLSRLGATVERFQVVPEQERGIATAIARAGRDTVIVTFGAAAAAAVGKAKLPSATVPVVNCMVLGAAPPRAGGPQSVPLEIPADTQAAWIKRLLPRTRVVGILYDPAQNEARAAESADAMRRVGIAVVTEAVPNPQALPVALQRLQNHVDVVQALADTTVYAREHARALLLFSFRQQIPIVGPTESWVKAGALFALDWDYADLGRYCGALALRQIAGSRAAAPAPPRTRVVANGRVAERLRVHWDAQQLQLIDKVY